MKKQSPWNEIKIDYLAGTPPRELAKIHNRDVKKIQDKIGRENWAEEKARISKKTHELIEDRISVLTNKSLETLEEIIDDPEAKHSDKIQASKAILDVSGLKTQKQEITGKNGEPLGVVKEYILPEEVKSFEEHYKKAIEEK